MAQSSRKLRMNSCLTGSPCFSSTREVTVVLSRVDGLEHAIATEVVRLNRQATDAIAAYRGAYFADPGEIDTFGAIFEDASDAVAAALELQRAALAAIKPRIGIHTGELGPFCTQSTMRHAIALRDFANRGQTVISRTTKEAVHGYLPHGAWLLNLRAHVLDREGLEEVVQVCHTDLCSDFSPTRWIPKSKPA
ncbi:adenylate/guanylate cyclase domain-containing protein [Mycobacterium persicum]|nr:adenylate/guanylate cyclase domain-containing protein [Mycobacterium persicum]